MHAETILTKRVRDIRIDVHPLEQALIIHYRAEAMILGEAGEPVIGDEKECQKIVRLKNLSNQTDLKALALKTIDSCDLLAPSRLPEIEHLLTYLRDRPPKSISRVNMSKTSINEKLSDPGAFDSAKIDEVASMTDLDDYLDLLYEDSEEQLRASALILQLARNPDNLEEILKNEVLIGALARVLREEWRKNTDLTTNLVYIFFCFSSFSNFHGVIISLKIGAHCMGILEHEMQSYADWMEDLKGVRAEQGEDCPAYKANLEKVEHLVRKQEQLFRVTIYLLLNLAENVEVEEKMCRKGIVTFLCRCLDRKNRELLILVVSFLRKLSLYHENIYEMIKNKVVEALTGLFTLGHSELTRVTLRLLYNLSFNEDLRASMIAQGLPKKLVPLLGDLSHRSVALRILYQLSIEDGYKGLIASSGCLPVLMRSILSNTTEAPDVECLGLLINLACDRGAACSLGEPRGIRMLFDRALRSHDPLIMKLLRNLSQFEEIRMHFVDHLPDLVSSIVSLVNVGLPEPGGTGNDDDSDDDDGNSDSENGSFTSDDCEIQHVDNAEYCFSLECLGVLANLQLEELDFARILGDLGLLSWIEDVLSRTQKGCRGDYLLLEVVRMLATACIDVEAAKMVMLHESPVISRLTELMTSIQEDDEMVYNILCTFYRLLRHEEVRQQLIKETEVPNYIFDLMHDENEMIRGICNAALNIIADSDETWAETIRVERFRWHNSQWLQMISNASAQEVKSTNSDGEDEGDANDFLPHHDYLLASNLLDDAADWFTTSTPPLPPTSSLDFATGDDGELQRALHDASAYYEGAM